MYRFTIINAYGSFMKESESEVLCTDSTAQIVWVIAIYGYKTGHYDLLSSSYLVTICEYFLVSSVAFGRELLEVRSTQ
jgi:hypothetical protein